jgi:uncharacterized protein
VKLRNAIIIITGASSGIGAATALELAKSGARLALLSRTQSKLEALAAQVRTLSAEVLIYPVDLSDQQAVSSVHAQICQDLGTPDVIVHAAGLGRWLWLEETAPDEVLEMLSSPFLGALWLTQACLPEMLERDTGRIVFVGSPVAWMPWPGANVYAISRWALRGLFEALRVDLACTNIGLTMIVPGQVRSPYFDHNPGVTERFPSLGKLVRVLEVEEVAHAIRRALERDSTLVALPWLIGVLLRVSTFAPWFTHRLAVWSGVKHPKAGREKRKDQREK